MASTQTPAEKRDNQSTDDTSRMTSGDRGTHQIEMKHGENNLTRHRFQHRLGPNRDESQPAQPSLPEIRPADHFHRHNRHQPVCNAGKAAETCYGNVR